MSKSIARSLRLDRLLSNLGYGSRREVSKLIQLGLVALDGKMLSAANEHVNLTHDLPERLRIDNEMLDPMPGMIVMLHKPLGVTCSHKETGRLVYDLLPERWQRRDPPLSTIGRLDKETSGLLLLTDDGEFLHRIISPRSHVTKRYSVTLAVPLRGTEQDVFASGTMLLEDDDKPLLPVHLEILSPTMVYVTLTEGRYHQIRRMFAAMNNEVIKLHRDHIGSLSLPSDLEAGQYRLLKADEVAAVLKR
jgi:16S rRNA pseudouridine516 synthase